MKARYPWSKEIEGQYENELMLRGGQECENEATSPDWQPSRSTRAWHGALVSPLLTIMRHAQTAHCRDAQTLQQANPAPDRLCCEMALLKFTPVCRPPRLLSVLGLTCLSCERLISRALPLASPSAVTRRNYGATSGRRSGEVKELQRVHCVHVKVAL